MWISEQGEVLGYDFEKHPGDSVWDDSIALPEERAGLVDDQDEWLPDWYLEQLVHMDAEEAAEKAQHALRVKRLKARRKWLERAYGGRMEFRVQHDLDDQKGKKKSVDYAYGKCGWSTSSRIEIDDEPKAVQWLAKNHQAGLGSKLWVLKKELPEKELVAGEIPGVSRIKERKFFARAAK